MEQQNNKFRYTDFISNREFIEWRLFKTEEQETYWQNFIKENPDCQEALATAIERFSAVRINDYNLSNNQKENLLGEILKSSSQLKVKHHRKLSFYWAAAVCAVLVFSTAIFLQKEKTPASTAIVGRVLPSKDIQLISGSKVVTIAQNSAIQLKNNGSVSLTQTNEKTTSEIDLGKEEMNRLIVPYGRRTTLTLSDGSKIWLNSGTQLDFPTRFKKESRNVTVNGEIYIEVAKNKEQPFYVHTGQFSVKVLGTIFNVSSYSDSEEKSVVLVEGKVEVQTANQVKGINPGEMFEVKGNNTEISKVNVNEYISWKDGIFYFKHATINNILKKIGRYYNVDFSNSQSPLLQRTCTGQLYLSEDIDKVMDIISVLSNTDYQKSGSKISILPNKN